MNGAVLANSSAARVFELSWSWWRGGRERELETRRKLPKDHKIELLIALIIS